MKPDRAAINRHIENVETKVEYVLGKYYRDKGCPCGIKQFVYWAGKQQGPGWQDNIQNQLVVSALELACFERIDDCEKSWGLEGSYTCTNCGVKWNYFSLEWRMLAFHRRMVKVGADDPGRLYDEMICDDVAATVGHEPDGKKALSLEQWVAFMLGRDYTAQPYKASYPVIKKTKAGFWQRLLAALRRGK
ncbi:hypothetical protein DRQ25_09525 [Candidatus Fermentibacteria bacterium]|nr:MAG: hypothetical protein DRQ25_09525 [Candidatus Fermentibacteria bacterium]